MEIGSSRDGEPVSCRQRQVGAGDGRCVIAVKTLERIEALIGERADQIIPADHSRVGQSREAPG